VNPSGDASASLVRADVLVLLREKRYEDALARLYQARTDSPDSVELQKSIDQVKEFLIGAYAKRLGGLDQVARPFATAAARSPDVVLLSRYIDGATTYGDLAEMSPLGRLRTLQVLIEMYVRQPASVDHAGVPDRSGHPSPVPLAAGPEASGSHRQLQPVSEPAPETARSASAVLPAYVDHAGVPVRSGLEEDPDTQHYREAFARGTAAFIQNRFADAVEAFEACARLRPGDSPAQVMLRRARRDLESRS
jgi:hypothetical protein